ncbi:MAG: pentapeptide repeat-containing protein [Chroococcidiopsidaceae cyanobacterium CP_BM_RX_35]|nr:pentapeptide repeat-containing protein [Chroococcidiopsidaceae cyanobacterium CP_BM_RX_35]
MKAAEVIRLYETGQRNFPSENLRGQSFKGQDLSEANFSGTDIRGADFSNAILIGTNFSHAQAGLQRRWVILLVVISFFLAGLSGFASALTGSLEGHLLLNSGIQNQSFVSLVSSGLVLILFTLFCVVTVRQGLEAAFRFLTLALVMAVASVGFGALAMVGAFLGMYKFKYQALAIDLLWFFVTDVHVAWAVALTVVMALAGIVAGAGAVALVLTVAGAVAGFTAVALALALTVAGAGAGSIAFTVAVMIALSLARLSKSVVSKATNRVLLKAIKSVVVTKVTVALAGAGVISAGYIGWRTVAGDEKFALIRSITIAFAATGGTSFRGADLTNADFTSATLKSTDFRGAILTRTCWAQAKKLDRVRPGTTYLRNVQLRQWLMGNGRNKDFDRQVLRGVNLKGANLANASFIGADLSEANLQNADLFRAKLVQTQLDETDLTEATLTGACIEDWGITSHTKLDGVRCEYVFMRDVKQGDPDPNPRRKPDNWNETFQEGDFADFIKPIADTLDLYHNQNVDPRTITLSFKQLADNHPEAELEIVAMEKRGGDKLLLRAKTAPEANHSELSAEYFSTYEQLKSLPENALIYIIADKDHQIRLLAEQVDTALKTAIERPSIHAETYHSQGDTMSEKSETSSYNLSQAKFGGGFAGTGGTQTGGTLNDYSSSPNLSEAAAEIQQILNQLEVNNPATTRAEKMTVAAKAVDEIEKNSVLKTRVIAALKSGGTEAFKEEINHPLAKNIMPIVEEWASEK